MMTFPSDEYVEECTKNAKALGKEWEKRGAKIGDYCFIYAKRVVLITQRYGDGFLLFSIGERHREYSAGKEAFGEGKISWVPRPDQLMEMLEERGYTWGLVSYQGAYLCEAFEEGLVRVGEQKGPDPVTAFLRALLEVIEKEDNDEISQGED